MTDRPAPFDDPVQFNFVVVVVAIVGSNLDLKNSRALRDPNRDLTIFDSVVIQFLALRREVWRLIPGARTCSEPCSALTFMVKVINFSSLFSASGVPTDPRLTSQQLSKSQVAFPKNVD